MLSDSAGGIRPEGLASLLKFVSSEAALPQRDVAIVFDRCLNQEAPKPVRLLAYSLVRTLPPSHVDSWDRVLQAVIQEMGMGDLNDADLMIACLGCLAALPIAQVLRFYSVPSEVESRVNSVLSEHAKTEVRRSGLKVFGAVNLRVWAELDDLGYKTWTFESMEEQQLLRQNVKGATQDVWKMIASCCEDDDPSISGCAAQAIQQVYAEERRSPSNRQSLHALIRYLQRILLPRFRRLRFRFQSVWISAKNGDQQANATAFLCLLTSLAVASLPKVDHSHPLEEARMVELEEPVSGKVLRELPQVVAHEWLTQCVIPALAHPDPQLIFGAAECVIELAGHPVLGGMQSGDHYRINLHQTRPNTNDQSSMDTEEDGLDDRLAIGRSFVQVLRSELLLSEERSQWWSRLDDVCYGGPLVQNLGPLSAPSISMTAGKATVLVPLGGGGAGKGLGYFGYGVGHGAWELLSEIIILSLLRVGLRLKELRADTLAAIKAYATQPLTLRMIERAREAQHQLTAASGAHADERAAGTLLGSSVLPLMGEGEAGGFVSSHVDEATVSQERNPVKVPESMQKHFKHFSLDSEMNRPDEDTQYHMAVVDALQRTKELWIDTDSMAEERELDQAVATCLTGSSDPVHLSLMVYPDPHRHRLRIRCCLINLSNIDIEGLQCVLATQGPVCFADHTKYQHVHAVPGKLRPRAVTEWDMELEVLRFGRIRALLELVFKDADQDAEDIEGGGLEDVVMPVEEYPIPLNALLLRPPPHRRSIACFREQWANTSYALYADAVSSSTFGDDGMVDAVEERCKHAAVGLGWVGRLAASSDNLTNFTVALISETWEELPISMLLTGALSAADVWSVRMELRCTTRAVAEVLQTVFEGWFEQSFGGLLTLRSHTDATDERQQHVQSSSAISLAAVRLFSPCNGSTDSRDSTGGPRPQQQAGYKSASASRLAQGVWGALRAGGAV
eukprot:g1645.t1